MEKIPKTSWDKEQSPAKQGTSPAGNLTPHFRKHEQAAERPECTHSEIPGVSYAVYKAYVSPETLNPKP